MKKETITTISIYNVPIKKFFLTKFRRLQQPPKKINTALKHLWNREYRLVSLKWMVRNGRTGDKQKTKNSYENIVVCNDK